MTQIINWFSRNYQWFFSGAGIALVGFLCQKFYSFIINKTLTLKYSYTRAFGAFQVPFFFRAMGDEYSHLGTLLPTDDVKTFWENWPHKQCRIMSTMPYKELFDNERGFYNISNKMLEDVCLKNPISADFFLTKVDESLIYKHNPHIYWGIQPFRKYELYREIVPGKYSVKEVEENIGRESKEVGFLFLIIENYGDKPLSNLRLDLNCFKNPHPFTVAINKKELALVEKQQLIIKNIDSKEKLLLLLEVYKKDENGYAKDYFSSVVLPKSIKNTNRMRRMAFNMPNREKAAKILFPFGWTGQ